MSVDKVRVSVTLTMPYLDGLARLVKDGLYLDRGSAILASIRLLLKVHGRPLGPEEAVGW